jgi:hypothetical protein
MKRRGPLTLALVMGILMMVQFFVPHPVSTRFYRAILDSMIIIGVFMLVFAWRSLAYFHINRIRRKTEHWQYSFITLAGWIAAAGLGIALGMGEGTPHQILFNNVLIPLQATMFSLLAFYIASAAFRAFKARNLEAALLLVTALIVMLGRVPIGQYIYKRLPEVVEWIMMYPNMAAQRGILLGVGLGMISTALKIVMGIERGYLGGGD